jgi:hypothetical protein
MIIIGILLATLAGLSILSMISDKFSVFERIGLGYIIGLGLITFSFFLFNVIGVKGTFVSINAVLVVTVILGYFIGKGNLIKNWQLDKALVSKYALNGMWLVCFILISYLLYVITKKALYWPTLEFDSVTGYDYMARAIAREGFISNSIIENMRSSREYVRILYPPFASCTFAYAYLWGASQPNLIVICHFAAFFMVFYTWLLRFTNPMGAILFTLGALITPEFFSHAAMALSNLPNALHTGIMFISLFIWIKEKEMRYLLIALIFATLNTFTRSDAVVFSLVAIFFVLIETIKDKKWLNLVIFTILSLSSFIAWNVFAAKVLHAEGTSNYFVKHLFWDSAKIGQIFEHVKVYMYSDTGFYGLTFWVFYFAIFISAKAWKNTAQIFLLITVMAWFGYTALYYQMDNEVIDSLEFLMKASYKRGLFNFVPLCWFYVAISPAMVWVFNGLEKFLYEK